MQPFILSILLSFLLTRRCIKIILVFSLNITGPRQKLRGGVGFLWTASWGAEHPLMPVGKIFLELVFGSRPLTTECWPSSLAVLSEGAIYVSTFFLSGFQNLDHGPVTSQTPLKRIWGCMVCCVDELQRLLKLWLVKRVAIGFHKTKMLLKIHTHYAWHS